MVIRRLTGRWLCRAGWHRWGRVREITGLDFKSASRAPNGDAQLHFLSTGHRYVIACGRPDCRVTQGKP